MKYNSKRTRNLFDPHTETPYKISRSKIELFIECPRCFYLDRRSGVGRPPTYPFNLNLAVDLLLKREFDLYRSRGTRHPLMEQHKIDAIPFQHTDLHDWRENFIGIQYLDESSNFIISGAIDDVWQNPDGELIVVDYKATSREGKIYMNSPWYDSYKRQLDIYQWLFRKIGFHTSKRGYFVYCNGNRNRGQFENRLEFDIDLISYDGSDNWIEPVLIEIRRTLSESKAPKSVETCNYCAYRKAIIEAEHPGSLL